MLPRHGEALYSQNIISFVSLEITDLTTKLNFSRTNVATGGQSFAIILVKSSGYTVNSEP